MAQLKELDRILLAVVFVILVGFAAFFAHTDKVFELASDSASAVLGALVVLITKKEMLRK